MLLCVAIIAFLYYYANTFPLESRKLSGSFAEFRGNHFHTGIDISTDGVEGYPVIAPTDGYISYIKQDYLGYGKALFLNNSDYIFVFGHLQDFAPCVKQHLDKNHYKQVLYPHMNTIKVKEGDTIAYAGRSGTYIPHLHFEMRSLNNNPISPYDYFNLTDSKAPELKHIIVEPADDTTLINGRHETAIIKGYRYSDTYYNFSPVNIRGTFRIYPVIIDRQMSETARLFVHTIDIFSRNSHIYHCSIDSVSFELSAKSPILFRPDLDFRDKNYVFNPHASLPWLTNNGMRILYSSIDTIITFTATDFANNRSIGTVRISNDIQHSSGPDEIKIHKVNGKLVVSFPKQTEEGLNISGFDKHDCGYLYYIFNTNKHIKGRIRINSTFIHYDFLCIDRGHIHRPLDEVSISTQGLMYCLFDTKKALIDGLHAVTDIMDYQLCNRYQDIPFEYIVNGYAGFSLYMKRGEKFRFIRHLTDTDTVYSHYLQSFVIGRDIEMPTAEIVYYANGKMKLRLNDNVSGIDWRFIGESNPIFNIPDPQKGTVELYIRNAADSLFFIRDMEGNTDTIKLR